MSIPHSGWRQTAGVLALGAAFLASCTTVNSRPLVSRTTAPTPPPAPVPPPEFEPPPVLALNHFPARDPALALIYQNPDALEAVAPPRRETRRLPGNLSEQLQRRQVELWKQSGVPPQAEPLLLEDLLRLNLEEDSRVPAELLKLLLRTESELPLTLNEQVMRYVNYFLNRGRKTLEESLRRAGAYRPMISRILAEHGIPHEMIYLVQAESGFRPTAVSAKRATGMWQFVSWRGKEYGLNQNRHVDERLDPEKATVAAARHLADLYAQFGNWYLAMAAYNCGPGCVQRAVERTGYADFWEFVARGVLPRETANYVPVILALAFLAKNADAFGLDGVVPEPPIRYDTVTTTSRIGIGLIADATGATPARIKQLNPALLGSATPDSPYALRIPKGTAEQFEREISQIPPERRISWRRHQVREGETLSQIAARYRVKREEIAAVNLLAGGQVQPGERLTIPVPQRPQPVRRFRGAPSQDSPETYTVRKGDTLGSIARRYGVTVAELEQWNRVRSTRLQIGQVLAVRSGARAASRQVASQRHQKAVRAN